jgi:hypothetical protein
MRSLGLCLLILTCSIYCLAQKQDIPIVRTANDRVTMYLDGEKDDLNGISKIEKKFDFSFVVEKDSLPLVLVSEKDSIVLLLRPGQTTSFLIVRESTRDTVLCSFNPEKKVKAATFSEAYKAQNEGKISVELPEVYELINVIFALTEYGKTEAIYKDTDYYKKVIKQFGAFGNHQAVRSIDSLLQFAPEYYYNRMKMDGYAFVFQGDKIVNGGVYDRVSWGDRNELTLFIPLLIDFARKTEFRKFFKQNSSYYDILITEYQKEVGIAGMIQWLEKQFPSTRYSATKVIFSPLVGWNQSANMFSDNGFTESQAHVNFPFLTNSDKSKPADVIKGTRKTIVFTEINHAYLNPEAEKYGSDIDKVFGKLADWTTAGKPSSTYNSPLMCFEEYMNYGLVTLYYSDILDQRSFAIINERIESNMTDRRGFQRFKAFNQELLNLYRNRQSGQTVADLYPAIINWAKGH